MEILKDEIPLAMHYEYKSKYGNACDVELIIEPEIGKVCDIIMRQPEFFEQLPYIIDGWIFEKKEAEFTACVYQSKENNGRVRVFISSFTVKIKQIKDSNTQGVVYPLDIENDDRGRLIMTFNQHSIIENKNQYLRKYV